MKVFLLIIFYILLIFTILLLLTSKREVLGIRSYTVLTDSMKPSISSGDLIVVRRNQEYHTDDVITFKSGGVEVTHRIIAIKNNKTDTYYQTRGDANTSPDISYVYQKSIQGKVIIVVPVVGTIAQFLKTIPGLFLFIVLPGMLFIFMELRNIHHELKIMVFLCSCIVSIMSNLSNSSTVSFVNDTAVSTENNFSQSSIALEDSIANHIVISEVQTSGATAGQDFIELYNPTSQNINLTGWRIRKKSSAGTVSTLVAITSGKNIPAHGFFLWSNSGSGYDSAIGADISNTNTISDNNSIELQDADLVTIDQVGWGTGVNQFFEGAIIPSNLWSFSSLERKARATSNATDMAPGGQDAAFGNGYDSDNNNSDFTIRSQSQPQNSLSDIESL